MKKIYFVNKSIINSKNYGYLLGFKEKRFKKEQTPVTLELIAEKEYNKKLIENYLAKIYPDSNNLLFENYENKNETDKILDSYKNLPAHEKNLLFKGWVIKQKLNNKKENHDVLIDALIQLILDELTISEKSKLKLKSKSDLIKKNIKVKNIPNKISFDQCLANIPNHFIEDSLINSLKSFKHKKKFFIKKK